MFSQRVSLSVVICTANPPSTHELVLNSLFHQSLDPEEYEVIVVENGRQRGVSHVIKTLQQKSCVRLSYEYEPLEGLSYARNHGIAVASGDVIAFLDDDALADYAWAANLMNVYKKGNEDVQCVGGRVLWNCDSQLPTWWDTSLGDLLGIFDLGTRAIQLGYPVYPYGSNISFRREVFENIGFFSQRLGRRGKQEMAGEEYELCLRVERAGGGIFYTPEALVYQELSSKCFDLPFLWRRAFCHGKSMAMIEAVHFGRRFVLWRLTDLRRSALKRRERAFRELRRANYIIAESVVSMKENVPVVNDRRTSGIRLVFQGAGYTWQLFKQELWRAQSLLKFEIVNTVHGHSATKG